MGMTWELPHSVLEPVPTRPAQKRDTRTRRTVKSQQRGLTDRGLDLSKAAKDGAGEYPVGQRLAPDIGHRVDTGQ